jgi:CheY-like chemotaxis protein
MGRLMAPVAFWVCTHLDVLVEMLREAGFTVTPAHSGLAMREILAAENPGVDAVVLDCRMPGEPSAQLALHARSLRLPVVMISVILRLCSSLMSTAFNCSQSRSEWRVC